MKKFFSKLTVVVCVLYALLSCSCSSFKGDFMDVFYFNTFTRIETHDKPISNSTKEKIELAFSSLEKEFDLNDQNSFVHAFNSADEGQTFTLSIDAFNILSTAKNCYAFSNGLFDPTVYPLVELWQFSPNFPVPTFNLPSQEQIDAQKTKLNFDGVLLDEEQLTVKKTDPSIKLDFGGIVKGYAADLASKILVEDGHSKGYVNVGGSSLNVLSSNSLGVRHPRSSNNLPLLLDVNLSGQQNVSVSTSGDYEKTYTLNGKTYCHIINTKTGKPIETCVASVTTLGIDGASADALTTAACAFDHDINDINASQLVQFLKKITFTYKGCSVYAVYDDGNVKQVLTNKIENEHFTLLDNSYTVVNF